VQLLPQRQHAERELAHVGAVDGVDAVGAQHAALLARGRAAARAGKHARGRQHRLLQPLQVGQQRGARDAGAVRQVERGVLHALLAGAQAGVEEAQRRRVLLAQHRLAGAPLHALHQVQHTHRLAVQLAGG
jgi:hypothetical protein